MNDTFTFALTLIGCLGYGAACIAGALLIDRRNQRDVAIARLTARYRIQREDSAREADRMAYEAQRRSFAYGNAHLSNHLVTREMVDAAADELDAESGIRCVDDEEPITLRTVGT
jgi:hypothetical protein